MNINRYIVVNCKYSDLEWMKRNILKSISIYLDLSNVDWDIAWKNAQHSFVKDMCEAWETKADNISIVSIANDFKLEKHTLIKYLNQLQVYHHTIRL
jgi:hypothetical protein